MTLSLNTQAILLLTTWFAKAAKSDPKPLTPTEWGRLALWLKEQDKTPAGLLESGSPAAYLNGWPDTKITSERIEFLLGRSVALSLSLEKWQRAGLWVMTRSDADYPSRLKKHLKSDAPPVLFGCGNRQLLDRGGIAMVGSRDATPEQLAATTRLAGEMALQGFSVVSGGARGVDEVAMMGALAQEGTVIGILADSLLRCATSAKFRNGLMMKNLVLVSPFNPEAGFDVGNAMARNKYIYCLSDAAIVVATSKGSGGTWSGATENLKRNWVPLWVLNHPGNSSGNAALVHLGAGWLPDDRFMAGSLFDGTVATVPTKDVETSLFNVTSSATEALAIAESPASAYVAAEAAPPGIVPKTGAESEAMTFYDFFLKRLETVTNGSPATVENLLATFDISKTQLGDWIKRGIAEGRLKKLNKPVRYMTVKVKQEALDL